MDSKSSQKNAQPVLFDYEDDELNETWAFDLNDSATDNVTVIERPIQLKNAIPKSDKVAYVELKSDYEKLKSNYKVMEDLKNEKIEEHEMKIQLLERRLKEKDDAYQKLKNRFDAQEKRMEAQFEQDNKNLRIQIEKWEKEKQFLKTYQEMMKEKKEIEEKMVYYRDKYLENKEIIAELRGPMIRLLSQSPPNRKRARVESEENKPNEM